jgi:hypothetical protein
MSKHKILWKKLFFSIPKVCNNWVGIEQNEKYFFMSHAFALYSIIKTIYDNDYSLI